MGMNYGADCDKKRRQLAPLVFFVGKALKRRRVRQLGLAPPLDPRWE